MGRERETLSEDTHSNSNHFSPASIAWVRKWAGKLEVSYAHTRVSSKSRTTCMPKTILTLLTWIEN